MPNVNNPHGLQPLMRGLNGGQAELRTYRKPSAQAAIFRNDAVIAITGGTQITNQTGYPSAKSNIGPQATAGSGTFVGVSLNYAATGVISDHHVIVSPDTVYDIQDDGVGGGLVVANLGKHANTSLAVAGSATTGMSGQQLGQASVATTNTLDLKIQDLVADITNSFGANTRVMVTLNRHLLMPGTAGV
jgi:hypothetical protein